MRRHVTHTVTVVLLAVALVTAPVSALGGVSAPGGAGLDEIWLDDIGPDEITLDDTEPDDVELERDEISTERGDVATFTATAVDGPVRFEIGSAAVGYNVVATLNDTDGDGSVTLRFNTARSPEGKAAYTAGDDTLSSVETVESVGLVLAATVYDVEVGPVGGDATSISAFVVEPREPADVQTLTAPATHTLDDETALRRGLDRNTSGCSTGIGCDPTVAPTNTVAYGDQLLVQFNDPALVGLLTAQNTTTEGYSETNATTQFLTAVETGVVRFELLVANGPDREPRRLAGRLGTNNTHVVADRANDTHYVVVNTTRATPDEVVGSGLTVRGGPDVRGLKPVDSESPPESRVTVAEPTARLATDVVGADGEITVETNLAPGTELRVVGQRTGVADGRFITVTRGVVDRDGETRVAVVPSDIELAAGERFTVRSAEPTRISDEFETNVTTQPETATDSPTPTPVGSSTATPTETATDSPTPTPVGSSTATPTETATDSPTETRVSSGSPTPTEPSETATSTPGFGFLVAVTAVLVAATLARRRE
jgi:PGF-CTERM protein